MPESITRLDQLKRALDMGPGIDAFTDVFSSLDLDKSALQSYSFWSPDHYTRNRIFATGDYELYLICWEQGQRSPIHDHNGQQSWIYVVDGSLREEQFVQSTLSSGLSLGEVTILKKGAFVHITDVFRVHRIGNADEGRSMSLHLNLRSQSHRSVYKEDGNVSIERIRLDSSEGYTAKE